MKARRWLTLAAGVVVIGLGVNLDSTGSPGKGLATTLGSLPNIVVLMTDDMHVLDMHADAAIWSRMMPNVVGSLMNQGTTFSQSFVSTSLCCPSRATFLRGQYEHTHQVWSNSPDLGGGYQKFKSLGEDQETVPVWLQRVGYYTIHIGKYLNGYGGTNPTEIPLGWTEWHGNTDSIPRYYGYTLNEQGTLVTYAVTAANYQTDVYAAKAAQFIRGFGAAHPGQPFFMWLAFTAPHSAFADQGHPTPPRRYSGTADGEALPTPPNFNEADISDKPSWLKTVFPSPMDAATIGWVTDNYHRRLETLRAVDDAVATVLQALQDSGTLGQTVVIFTSDNGYFHGEHRIPYGKIRLYEESIRVPLIVRGPGVPANQTLGQLAVNIDLAPTIVDFAQASAAVPTAYQMEGMSLVPLMADPSMTWRTGFFVEGPVGGLDSVYTAVRSNRFLWAIHRTGEKEVYDLQQDPYELQNVGALVLRREPSTLRRWAERLGMLAEPDWRWMPVADPLAGARGLPPAGDARGLTGLAAAAAADSLAEELGLLQLRHERGGR